VSDKKRYNNIDFQNVFTGVNVPDPVNNTQISNKQYVDNTINSLILAKDKKDAVKALISSNVVLASACPNVVDDVTLSVGDRVAVIGQSTQAQNGIYTVQTLGTGSNGVWIRSTDANTSAKVTQGLCFDVSEGTLYAGKSYLLVTPDVIVLNTTALNFIQTNIGSVRSYSTTIANGQSTYLITHGLNKAPVTVSVKETVSGEYSDGIIITHNDLNSITLDFGINIVNDHDISVLA
jgi:hypothetical protein